MRGNVIQELADVDSICSVGLACWLAIALRAVKIVSVETLADGYHKKIPLPRVPSIAQAQAHSAQVQLYRTMITGPRYEHIPRGTTHIPHVTIPTVPRGKRLTLTSIPHGHGTAIPLHDISQKISYFTQQITQLVHAIM